MDVQKLVILSLYFCACAISAVAEFPTCGTHIQAVASGIKGPDGNVYLLESQEGNLVRVDTQTGMRTIILSGENFGSNVGYLRDLAFESGGEILIAGTVGGVLVRVVPATGSTTPLHTDVPVDEVIGAMGIAQDGSIFVASLNTGSVYRVNPVSGTSSLVSGLAIGAGPQLMWPTELQVSVNGQLFLTDYFLRAVVRVDPISGDRVIVSGPQVGAGPNAGTMTSLLLRKNGNLLTYSEFLRAIVEIDGKTGDRTIYAAGPGSVQLKSAVTDLLDEFDEGLELLASDNSPHNGVRVVAVDAATGTYSTIARSSHIWDIAIAGSGEMYAAMPMLSTVFRLDQELTLSSIVADETFGNGPDMFGLLDLIVDDQGQLLFTDLANDWVVQLDPVSGDRTVVSGEGVGTGPPLINPTAIVASDDGDLFVFGRNLNQLIRVDRTTGDRIVILDETVGDGAPLGNVNSMVMEDADHIIAVEHDPALLVRITVSNGNREVISGGTTGSGPPFVKPHGIALGDNNTAFVKGDNLIRVDLADGSRVALFEDNVPHSSQVGFASIARLPDGRLLAAGRIDFLAVYSTTGQGRELIGDLDFDGMSNTCDNCSSMANSIQFDSDNDGFGNHCDADLNNDCFVNFQDLGLLKANFFGADATSDLNVDGQVDVQDLGLMRTAFFGAPGPSANAVCR